MRWSCRPDDRPIDLVLVLDASTTMLEPIADGRTKLDVAVDAAMTFATQLDADRVRIGVVAFNNEATALVGLTKDRDSVRNALLGVAVGKGSRIDLGLERARELLDAADREAGGHRLTILLSDGRPVGASRTEVLASARALEGSGATLYAVAVGLEADRHLLRELVTADYRLLDAVDGSRLERVFADIAALLDCP
jgi:Mg-chelatase subunit ChlD